MAYHQFRPAGLAELDPARHWCGWSQAISRYRLPDQAARGGALLPMGFPIGERAAGKKNEYARQHSMLCRCLLLLIGQQVCQLARWAAAEWARVGASSRRGAD